MANNEDICRLGQNIRALRLKNRLSQMEMAKLLKIGVKSLKSLERGVLPPRMTCDIFFYLYDHFGILPEECFKKTEENNARSI